MVYLDLIVIMFFFVRQRALLLVLTATLSGDYARRDAALAGDCDLGQATFLDVITA